MAHLRPGTVLAGHNKIGNFVETKKARHRRGFQGQPPDLYRRCRGRSGVNIGCGTITCNYDGVNKHKTVIEDDVFVGSDTQFVAPVRIGRGSLIGAGSTITRTSPPTPWPSPGRRRWSRRGGGEEAQERQKKSNSM